MNFLVAIQPPRQHADAGAARAAVVAGLRLLSVVAGLAYVKYYTNALSVEQVGHFFYLGTLSYVLNALVFVPVDSYMQARIASLEVLPAPPLRRLVLATLAAGLGASTAISIPFVALGLLSVGDVPLLYTMAALLYLCASVRNLLNIRGQSTFAASMVVMESVARLVAFVIAASTIGASARTLLMSSIAALAAELVILGWRARCTLPLSAVDERLDTPGHIVRTAAMLAGGAASNTVQLQAYRVIFPAAGHAPTAAALGVTANIGAATMGACAQVFSQLFLPRLYQSGGASISAYVRWGTAVAVGMLIVGLALAEFLVRHLTQAAYVPYAPAIGIGIVLEACNMLIGAYGVFLTLRGRTGALFHAQLTGAVLSLTGCLLLLLYLPQSPLMLGMVVAGAQLLVTAALGLYVYRLLQQQA